MLAVKLDQPHWALEDDEAKQVESAIKRVMRHQDMNVSQKQIDYLFAGYVVAMVYGTRLATTFIGKKPEAQQEPTVAAPGVFQFPTPGVRPG